MKSILSQIFLLASVIILAGCVETQAPLDADAPIADQLGPRQTGPQPLIPPAPPEPTEKPRPTPYPSPIPVPLPVPIPTPPPAPAPTPMPQPPTPTPPSTYNPKIELGAMITDIKIENTATESQTKVPFTLGHIFKKGNLLPNEGLAGKLADDSVFPLQVDVKALHIDGSVRHAIISGVLPSLAGSETKLIKLTKAKLSASNVPEVYPQDLVAQGLTASVNLKLNGVAYQVKLDDLLKTGKSSNWLKGPISNEFLTSASLKAVSGGAEHPHLVARFAVRAFHGLNKMKVDFIMENNWAYEPNPSDFTYDVDLKLGDQTVYTQQALPHYRSARWHKNYWLNGSPKIHIKHNIDYLIDSKAVPNYDRGLIIKEKTLADLKANFDKSTNGPMGNGIAQKYMPSTGGRPELGLTPSWGVLAILSMDKRAVDVTLGMGDLSGSWGAHFRDRNTDHPISLLDWPYMSLQSPSGDHKNPKTGNNEAFPKCTGVCANVNTLDVSHQAAFNYLPYLLTGEHYYMEELLFYAMTNVGGGNPHYRKFEKGLLSPEQARGQAWALRTLAQATYIVPDSHPMKNDLKTIMKSNMDWYNETYTNNPEANIFGVIITGYSVVYNDGRGIAPWQDDFFTSAVGHANDLDIEGALPLLKWKAKFTVGRMTNPGFCWILGSNYSLNIRDSKTSPFYTTFAEAYQKSVGPEITSTACASLEMAAAVEQKQNYMVGYPTETAGFPANMQPAMAYAADSGIVNAMKAWNVFDGRGGKPDYSTSPQFAIIPRK